MPTREPFLPLAFQSPEGLDDFFAGLSRLDDVVDTHGLSLVIGVGEKISIFHDLFLQKNFRVICRFQLTAIQELGSLGCAHYRKLGVWPGEDEICAVLFMTAHGKMASPV